MKVQLCAACLACAVAISVWPNESSLSWGNLLPDGVLNDDQTSINYSTMTGELGVDTPLGTNLTSVLIESAAGVFTGAPAKNLGGAFDIDSDTQIFKAVIGNSFGSLHFGAVAPRNLSQAFLLADLAVVGSLGEGGGLGDVDLVYRNELNFDCNGDGLIDVQDANCATAATIDGTLALTGLLKGDVDGNGAVEFADFLVLSANFGSPGQYTDGNLDKIADIGFPDFLILSSNFGQSSAVLANVPETTAGVLLGFGMLCLLVRRQRRQ